MTLAIKLGSHDCVNYLSVRGADLNQIDPENKTPLMHYLLYSQELANDGPEQEKVRVMMGYASKFISRGADVDFTNPNV